ncbi:DUF1476 domain-containing protein [Arenibaculum sp.]|uniref:DUF1476 domain-containing protein n=1 Tax=Arenibaculum sp. TaxID=2865862 RepID=UPI002E151710|nr:DUF1476 domain-containing protein [Arenibaculum sp.]
MPTRDDEQGQERRQAPRDEVAFKALARRNRLTGLWAAAEMGLSGEAAESYAAEVVLADLETAGDDDVIAKLRRDLEAGGRPFGDADIKAKLAEMYAEARRQLQLP